MWDCGWRERERIAAQRRGLRQWPSLQCHRTGEGQRDSAVIMNRLEGDTATSSDDDRRKRRVNDSVLDARDKTFARSGEEPSSATQIWA